MKQPNNTIGPNQTISLTHTHTQSESNPTNTMLNLLKDQTADFDVLSLPFFFLAHNPLK